MPRRSAADLAVRVDGRPTRLKPPPHLAADERRRFVELVGNCAPDHFRASDLPLLCRYVEADALAERAASELRKAPVCDGRINPWLTVQEKSVRTLVALSMRLRISPQSRSDPKTVGRQKMSVPSAYDLMDLGE